MQERTTVEVVRLHDPDPSSARLEALITLDPPSSSLLSDFIRPTAFGPALRRLRPDLAPCLPDIEPEDLVEPKPKAPKNPDGSTKRRASTRRRQASNKRPRITRPVPFRSAPIAPNAQLLVHTGLQWTLLPTQSGPGNVERTALAALADTRAGIPVLLTSSSARWDQGSAMQAESALARDQVYLFASNPDLGQVDDDPIFLAELPLFNTQAHGPYPGSSTGQWILAATRLARSQHVSIQASCRIERVLHGCSDVSSGRDGVLDSKPTAADVRVGTDRVVKSMGYAPDDEPQAIMQAKLADASPQDPPRVTTSEDKSINLIAQENNAKSVTQQVPEQKSSVFAQSFAFRLHLEVRVWLAPNAFLPSYTAQMACDFMDLLRFVGPQEYLDSLEMDPELPPQATTVEDFFARLETQQESLRVDGPDASTVYAALRPPILPSGPARFPDSSGSAEQLQQGSWTSEELAVSGHPGLEPVMLPYQRRTVGFLLGREGMRVVPRRESRVLKQSPGAESIDPDTQRVSTSVLMQDLEMQESDHEQRPDPPNGDAKVESVSSEQTPPITVADRVQGELVNLASCYPGINPIMTRFGPQDLGIWWERVHLSTVGDCPLFFNTIYGYFTFDPGVASSGNIKGSILAEEMGLGKTVELLSLMLWNPAIPKWTGQETYFSPALEAYVTPSKATLIIVPETLREQWMDEIHHHAPKLHIYSFETTARAEKDAKLSGYQSVDLGEGKSLSAWNRYAKDVDVVITSFSRLSTEVHLAVAERPRSRRTERKYARARSGLVTVGWWRVAVDEVQLLGGTTNAFTTASMVPRHMAICVSGTPVQSIKDLAACLAFLRVPGLAPPEDVDFSGGSNGQLGVVGDAMHWILDRRMKPQLMRLLAWIGVRHTKREVRSELTLPPQTRQLVPVEFSRIEREFYLDTWRQGMMELGLPATTDVSQTDIEERLRWENDPLARQLGELVRRMLQACTHPQVVTRSNLGALWGLRLRNINDVLALMIEQGHNEHVNMTLSSFQRKITRASLILQNKDDPHRLHGAQGLLGDVVDDLNDTIEHLIQDANEAEFRGPLYNFTPDQLKRALDAQKGHSDEEEGLDRAVGDQLKARSHQLTATRDRVLRCREQLHRAYQFLGHTFYQLGEKWAERQRTSSSPNEPTVGLPGGVHDVASETRANALFEPVGGGAPAEVEAAAPSLAPLDLDVTSMGGTASHNAQRDAQGSEHTNHSTPLVNPYKADEDRMYQEAEQLRRLLLNESTDLIEKSLQAFSKRRMDVGRQLSAEPPATWLEREAANGEPLPMVGRNLASMYRDLIHLLNKHSKCLFRWRMAIWERVSRAVNREVDSSNADDDQYAENLTRQGEAEAYLEMYRVLLAERDFIVTGVEVVGGRQLPAVYRELENTVHSARFRRFQLLLNRDEDSDEPEELVTARELLRLYQQLRDEMNGVSLPWTTLPLRKLSNELRAVSDRAMRATDQQLIAVLHAQARQVLVNQTKLLDRAKRDYTNLMTIYNARSTYFKRIQQLSDTVADVETRDVLRAIESNKSEDAKAARERDALAGRVRYLEHMRADNPDKQTGCERSKQPDCVICTDRIVHGVLLQACGHVVCEDCFRTWTGRKKTCPVCRTKMVQHNASSLHRVSYQENAPPEDAAESRTIDQTSVALCLVRSKGTTVPGRETVPTHGGRQLNLDEMHTIDPRERFDILETHASGNQGSKIDTLIRHLRYLMLHSNDKALVFSNFTTGLDMVAYALNLNNISYVRSDRAMSGTRSSRDGPIASRRVGGTKHCARVFQTDPSVRVFLLHADSQASGLNLLAARHVFLLAPMVNQSMEMQAIGRVHRIGQTKSTHVWGYFVLDSVEETMFYLAAQRGQSIFTKRSLSQEEEEEEEEEGEEEEASPAMPAGAPVRPQIGGELITSRDALLACLFRASSSA